MTAVPGSAVPYSESLYYATGLAANTTITLPNSGAFGNSSAKDILIIHNGIVKELTRDFIVIGAGPSYNQIQFIYSLPDHSVVHFVQGI